MSPLYLLRHGETEWNRDDRRQGRLGSDLTEKGVAQARAMGETLKPLLAAQTGWRLVSSPQERALRTANIVGGICALQVTPDDALMEIAMGSWEGKTWPEIDAMQPGASRDKRRAHFLIPDGESYEAASGRARAFLGSITGPTIAISHGVFGRVLRAVYLGVGWDGMLGLATAGQDGFFRLADGDVESVECVTQMSSDPVLDAGKACPGLNS